MTRSLQAISASAALLALLLPATALAERFEMDALVGEGTVQAPGASVLLQPGHLSALHVTAADRAVRDPVSFLDRISAAAEAPPPRVDPEER